MIHGPFTLHSERCSCRVVLDPDPAYGGKRYPPSVTPSEEDIAAVKKRWKELGLD